MSFILDALRKSESERRREAIPGIAHIPPAAPRNRAPPWVWIVMGALALGVLGLTAAWWHSTQIAPPTALEVPQTAEPRPSIPDDGSAEPRAAPVPGVAPPNGLDDPTSAAPSATGRLPSVAEVRAAGLALPELELQLISYSEDEAQRFVFINGYRYRAGQRVQNGPLLMSIAPDRVVLQQQGRDFVLTAE